MSDDANKTIIALDIEPNPWIRDIANAKRWQLTHLWFRDLPMGIKPKGALVQNLPSSGLVKKLQDDGCQVVRVGNLPHPDDHKLPAVLPDVIAEGEMAADHFHEKGFAHLGFFGHIPWDNGELLFQGFKERALFLGLKCHLHRFRQKNKSVKKSSAIRKENEFKAWIQGVPKPIGLLAIGDGNASTFCAWTEEIGLNIPDEVAILSRGNHQNICECMMPTLSCIELDGPGKIKAACQLLSSMMDGTPPPKEPILIPPIGVIERESTSVFASVNPTVATALKFIWDHFDSPISVEAIARASHLSSRQLERHFKKELGRSINEEILRKRLEEAKRLLRTSSQPISKLSPLIGIGSHTYFHRIFLKAFGLTPSQYRESFY